MFSEGGDNQFPDDNNTGAPAAESVSAAPDAALDTAESLDLQPSVEAVVETQSEAPADASNADAEAPGDVQGGLAAALAGDALDSVSDVAEPAAAVAAEPSEPAVSTETVTETAAVPEPTEPVEHDTADVSEPSDADFLAGSTNPTEHAAASEASAVPEAAKGREDAPEAASTAPEPAAAAEPVAEVKEEKPVEEEETDKPTEPAVPSDAMDIDYMPQEDKEDDWNMDLEPEWEQQSGKIETNGLFEDGKSKDKSGETSGKEDSEMLDADTAIPDDRKLKDKPKEVVPPPVPRVQVPDYIPQAHTIVIPSYASWFNVNRVHSIEKKSIPEFFNQRNSSKTPEVYKRYRAFMINTYRLHPTEYLTVTAVRRNLLGDVCAIMRVHQFLEKWGLINYQVDIEARPQMVAPPFTGHWEVTEDMPRGLFPFQAYKGTQFLKRGAEEGAAASTDDAEAAAKKAKTEEERGAITDITGETTAADDDTVVKTEPQTPQMEPFVQSDPEWTKREVYNLLNAIEEHGNDWTAISEGVGNKTREQCLLKFISLSIEDKFLEKSDSDEADGKFAPLKVNPKYLPFDHVDNPVLSVVSFLTGLVDPAVVGAMTGRGVEEIRKTLHLEQTEMKKQQLAERKKKREEEKKKALESAGEEDKDKNEGDSDSKKEDKEEVEEDEGMFPAGANDSTDAGTRIKDVPLETLTSLGYSTLGSKAQVFADFSEKEMYTDMFELVKTQADKLEMKMEKFAELERIIEMERRQLQMEREQVFLQRLLLNKKVKQVDGLLTQAAEETGSSDIINQAQAIVRGATKLSFAPTVQDQVLEDACVENSLDNVTPVTQEKKTFTFWEA